MPFAGRDRREAVYDGAVDGEAAIRKARGDDVFVPVGDVSLVVAIARRHVGALREVYLRYGGAIYDLAARVCGPEAADRVVHDAMVELWQCPDHFVVRGCTLRSVLLGRAHAQAVGVARHDRREATSPVVASRRAGSCDRASAAVFAAASDSRLAVLPGSERDAIVLAYLRGSTYREIAAALGEPPLAVARRIRSGLHRLARGSSPEEANRAPEL